MALAGLGTVRLAVLILISILYFFLSLPCAVEEFPYVFPACRQFTRK